MLADLAAAGMDDTTVARARVFARIGPEGTRVGDLAEQARVTKQTAGFLVDQLEKAGYVRRAADPSDGRARATAQLHQALTRLREVTDPYRPGA